MSLLRNRWLGLAVGALVLGGTAALACGGDDTSPAKPVADGGKTDTGPSTIDAGGDAGPSTYTKLGGHDGVLMFVHDVVTDVLKDPQQASFFVLSNGMNGHPTRGQIEECFADLVGHYTGGSEVYTGFPGSPVQMTPDGFTCRDMKTIHEPLHIPNGVFNDFVGVIAAHAAKAVTAGVITQAELDKVAALLGSTQPQIVDPKREDGGYFEGGPATMVDSGPADTGPADAGADG